MSTAAHEHHLAKARNHASTEAHAAVHAEAHHLLADTTAPPSAGAPPTQAEKDALFESFGFTGDEVRAMIAAKTVTPEQAKETHKVNAASIARAYTPAVTAALAASGSPIALGNVKPAKIATAAASVSSAATGAAKLRARATSTELAVRFDADFLDTEAGVIHDQVVARSAVDTETADTFAPITAYHHTRYPGHHAKLAATPATPATKP